MPRLYRFDYSIMNDAGEMVDTTEGGEPLSFVEGDGRMIPGLERALTGKAVGDEFKVSVTPEDAYGWPKRSLIRTLSPGSFEADVEVIEAGMIFQLGRGSETEVVKVVEVSDDAITVDANHPLAGLTLNFVIQVLEVRDATAEELLPLKRPDIPDD